MKPSHRGSVLACKVRAGWILCRGYPNGVGYMGFEVAGGCGSVTREGGLVGAKNQKPSSRGSILASEVWVGWFLGGGYPNGWGTWGLRWKGDVVRWRMKGAWWGPKTKNRAPGARFWLAKCGWAGFWVEGTLMGWGMSSLRWQGDVIWRHAKGGQKPKTELQAYPHNPRPKHRGYSRTRAKPYGLLVRH